MRLGSSCLAQIGTTGELADGKIDTRSTLYKDLKAKHFVYDDTSSPLFDVFAAKIRTKYDHLGGGKLHISS